MFYEYPSNISRKQFSRIELLLLGVRKITKPRRVDLYEVFCAILYVLKSGCQWRMLPSDFPKWSTCYSYFRKWSEKGGNDGRSSSVFEEVLQELVSCTRLNLGREEQTSFLIIDSQSVKNSDTAQEKGWDAGKKVSGIKRHIGVDTNGLPHVIHVTTADVTDRNGALEAFTLHKENLAGLVKVLADGGYTGEPFAASVKETLGASVEIAKRSDSHSFVLIPKRWVVERSFAWLEKCRRLWKNCERTLHSSLQMVVLAFISLILKRS
jgi:transposase